MRKRPQLLTLAAVAIAGLATCSIERIVFEVGDASSAEDCSAIGDENHNGLADCADPACTDVAACHPRCGDNIVQRDEVCDDGNTVAGDGCAADCTSFEGCGNHVADPGEVCDDGNTASGDGCSANCNSTEVCGNGIVDAAAGEVCDDGNTAAGDGCSADCKSVERCGNRVIEPREVCDDGNTLAGDGCSSNCQSIEVCGNHVVDAAVGETCDDGNTVSGDGCSSTCKSTEVCGNRFTDPDEDCDNGQGSNGDNNDCRSDCITNRCGDGHANTAGPNRREACDAAPAAEPGDRTVVPTETATCNTDCTVPSCGDRRINSHFTPVGATGPEQCDNGPAGNSNSADCTATCQISICGDGLVNTVGPRRIEDCDDGNRNDADDCSNACVRRPRGTAFQTPGSIQVWRSPLR